MGVLSHLANDEYMTVEEIKEEERRVKSLWKEGRAKIRAAFRKETISEFDLMDSLETNCKAYRHSDYNRIVKVIISEYNRYKFGVKYFTVTVELAFGHYLVAEIQPKHAAITFHNYPEGVKGIVNDDKNLAKAVLSYFYKKKYTDYEIDFLKVYASGIVELLQQQINENKRNRSRLQLEQNQCWEYDLNGYFFEHVRERVDGKVLCEGIDIQSMDTFNGVPFVLLTLWFSSFACAYLKYEGEHENVPGRVIVEELSSPVQAKVSKEYKEALKVFIPIIEEFFNNYR